MNRLAARRAVIIAALALAMLLAFQRTSRAWHHEGHHLITRAAVAALPESVPAFFRGRNAGERIAHLSIDADLGRDRLLPQLREAESPEHFIDYEYLQGKPLPPHRYAYIGLLQELKVEPSRAGFVPYAVTEWTQRLTMAFAEHRRWPDNEHIRAKCLFYAGQLAHYSADLAQPLHTTIHYNGRIDALGRGGRTGIHSKVDDLLYRFTLEDLAIAPGPGAVTTYDNVMAGVIAELLASHALVDRVYELEPKLPDVKEQVDLVPEVRAFALERGRAGARFTASLYLTAWENSAALKLPGYLDRAEQDQP